jgi:hypothetical protein
MPSASHHLNVGDVITTTSGRDDGRLLFEPAPMTSEVPPDSSLKMGLPITSLIMRFTLQSCVGEFENDTTSIADFTPSNHASFWAEDCIAVANVTPRILMLSHWLFAAPSELMPKFSVRDVAGM